MIYAIFGRRHAQPNAAADAGVERAPAFHN
jgi:hypothetical protein